MLLMCVWGGGGLCKLCNQNRIFISLQALEVYLGNVIPPDQEDWPVQSAVVLEELVANQVRSKL